MGSGLPWFVPEARRPLEAWAGHDSRREDGGRDLWNDLSLPESETLPSRLELSSGSLGAALVGEAVGSPTEQEQ